MKNFKYVAVDQVAMGLRIYLRREKKGISVSSLSEMLGVSVQAVNKWQNGSCSPSIPNLYNLSLILGVDLEYLLTGEGDDRDLEEHQKDDFDRAS